MREDYCVRTCSSPTQTKSVFERISASSSAELTKCLRFNDEDVPSDDEFIEVSVNMVHKDTGKQPASAQTLRCSRCLHGYPQSLRYHKAYQLQSLRAGAREAQGALS